MTATALAISMGALATALPASAASLPLVSAISGKCLDVSGGNSTPGTATILWDCTGQPNQGWDPTSASELRVFNDTLCLTIAGTGTAPGTQAVTATCDGSQRQKWTLTSTGTVVSKLTGLCLDVDHANTASGTNAIVWTCTNQPNQRWTRGGDANTLVVDANSTLRPVTHVANGFLYGLADASTPPASIVAPLKPNVFRQPPPNHQHSITGMPAHTGDTLIVDGTTKQVGSKILVDMADYLDGFPYKWPGWDTWNSDVDSMIAAIKARPDINNVYAYEPWNEPDGTWDTKDAGPFNDGWARTVQRIKMSDTTTPILGPSFEAFDYNQMSDFLTAAKASNTVPDIISWHELRGWGNVTGDVQQYRQLEQSLGISPRPISIDEYATPDEVDVPSQANHYVAQFERTGVTDAERPFWYEWGTLNGLLYNNSPTASYWMYKWYADQTGNIVNVVPSGNQDAVASYDASTKSMSIVYAGRSGSSSIRVDGVGKIGTKVKVVLSSTPGSGRQTNVSGPTTLTTTTYTVTNGSITIPVSNQDSSAAYQLSITAAP